MSDFLSEDLPIKMAELTRFGPQVRKLQEPENPPQSDQKTFEGIKKSLRKNGFKYGRKQGENDSWLGFSTRQDPSFAESTWQDLDEKEKQLIEDDKEIPYALRQSYKVCVNLPPAKIPGFIDLLNSQFADAPFIGKVAKPALFKAKSYPKVVLYVRGSGINEILDFTISLAKATKYYLGPSSQDKLIYAQEVEPDSGVFLTQGNFQVKKWAEKEGKFADYYGANGALFKETEELYPTYLVRRSNQILIEENLPYYAGYEKMSQRLLALQKDAFKGSPKEDLCGIRDVDVRVHRYYAPRSEELSPLLTVCDAKISEILNDPRLRLDYKYAVRSASAIYLLYMLVHPLADGNGQSCTNLISSFLSEAGHKRTYFRAFLDGKQLRAKALEDIQTQEATTVMLSEEATKPYNLEGKEKLKVRNGQDYARSFIRIATGELWPYIFDYLKNGKRPKPKRLLKVEDAVFSSFMSRLEEINRYCLEALASSPTGAKELDFGEQQMAVEEGKKLLNDMNSFGQN